MDSRTGAKGGGRGAGRRWSPELGALVRGSKVHAVVFSRGGAGPDRSSSPAGGIGQRAPWSNGGRRWRCWAWSPCAVETGAVVPGGDDATQVEVRGTAGRAGMLGTVRVPVVGRDPGEGAGRRRHLRGGGACGVETVRDGGAWGRRWGAAVRAGEEVGGGCASGGGGGGGGACGGGGGGRPARSCGGGRWMGIVTRWRRRWLDREVGRADRVG